MTTEQLFDIADTHSGSCGPAGPDGFVFAFPSAEQARQFVREVMQHSDVYAELATDTAAAVRL